jgi:hypothetical protein
MKRGLFAAGSLLWTIAGPAGAVGNLVDVTVFDRMENRALPVYRHEGRHYVVGKPGNEYQIRVSNRTSGEILSVVSVDGINAVSGETANWNQTGYVLGPHHGFDIKGWRKSLERVAAFFFTEHQNSYAARTGRPDNVGVIGVAVFRKKAEPEARIGESPPRPEPPAARAREDSPYRAGSRSGPRALGGERGRAAPCAIPAGAAEIVLARHRARPQPGLARHLRELRAGDTGPGGGDRHPLRHLQQPGGDGRNPGATHGDAVAVSGAIRPRPALNNTPPRRHDAKKK